MMCDRDIVFTHEKLKEFKKLFNKTPARGVFMFEGKEVLKEYAGYLIEYLESRLKER